MSMNRVPSEQSTHLHWLTQRSARRWCRLLMYTDSNIHFYLLFIGIVCVKSFIASAGLSPAPKTARNFTFGKSSCWELAIPFRPAAKRKHPRIFLCARLCSAPHICSVCVCVCVCVCVGLPLTVDWHGLSSSAYSTALMNIRATWLRCDYSQTLTRSLSVCPLYSITSQNTAPASQHRQPDLTLFLFTGSTACLSYSKVISTARSY